jgi:hypothetical protein
MELKGSKLGFLSSFIINIKFLIDRVSLCPTFFSRKDLSNEPSQVQFNPKELKLYLKSRNFLGKGPRQGQIPGVLGHGSKIPLVIL